MELVPADGMRLVLVTAPPGEAHALARRLVEGGQAACVNVVPGLRSVYRWQGALHDDPESLLLVKTSPETLPALLKVLHEQHPYEVPEALVLAPESGAAPYLTWLAAALAAGGNAPPAPR